MVCKVYASGETDFIEESEGKVCPVPKARVTAGESRAVLAQDLC